MRLFWWLCGVASAMGCGGNTGARRAPPAPAEAGAVGGSSAAVGGSSGGEGAAAGTTVAGSGGSEAGVAGASSSDAGAAGTPVDDKPRPYRALQITTGRYHTCALLENHQIKCWGYNEYGQLGLGLGANEGRRGLDPAQMGDALPFVDLGTGRSAKAVAAGRYTTCALLDDDSVKCWGMNIFDSRLDALYLLGDEPGEMGDALARVPLGAGRTAKTVAIGYFDACIALDDGSYYCSGSGSPTRLAAIQGTNLVALTGGNSVLALFEDGSVRTPGGGVLATGVVAMTGGEFVECFLLKSQLLQCRDNYGHQPDDLPTSIPDATTLGISQRGILCAIHQDGHVRCWGESWDQPWVTTPESESAESVVVPLSQPAVAVTSGAYRFHCALLQDGSVECWSWVDEPTDGVGWNAVGATELKPIDLGTFQPSDKAWGRTPTP